ncbi:MAG: FliH/SctL family protein [Candidatus Zixiibacteriota bacterium]
MSKLLQCAVTEERVIIGEYRADIEADRMAEKQLASRFPDVQVTTSLEGRKLIPIQEIFKIEERMRRDTELQRQKGYEEGYNKGISEGQKEARKVVANFSGLITDAVKQREILYEDARRKILELVLQIARKVTFDAARIEPDITAGIIAGTIKKLTDKSKIKVKVHPDHLPHIEQQLDRFRGDSTAVKELVIEADSRVLCGGCFIETPTGDVDARIDSQLDIIAEALHEVEGTP